MLNKVDDSDAMAPNQVGVLLSMMDSYAKEAKKCAEDPADRDAMRDALAMVTGEFIELLHMMGLPPLRNVEARPLSGKHEISLLDRFIESVNRTHFAPRDMRYENVLRLRDDYHRVLEEFGFSSNELRDALLAA